MKIFYSVVAFCRFESYLKNIESFFTAGTRTGVILRLFLSIKKIFKHKTLFSGNGRLYEPPNIAALTKVHNFGSDTFNRNYWFIGIQNPYQNGTLSYTSNALPIPFTIPEVSEHAAHNPDQGLLYLDGCNSQKYLHQDQADF